MAELRLAVRMDAIPIDVRKPGGLLKSLQMASKLGVSGVEIDARDSIRPSDLSDTGLRQLRKMLDDLNLRVVAIRFQTRRGYDNQTDLDRRVDATKKAMEFAYKLTCPVVVNQIGRVEEPDEDDQYSPAMEATRMVLDDLGRFGAKVGAFLAAETGTESGEVLGRFLASNEDSYTAVALNPGQLIVNRFNVRDAVAALGDRIHVVSATDAVLDLAAGRGLQVPMGQGTADFPELLGVLEDVPYRGPFVVGRVDMPPATALAELADGVSYLRAL